MDKSNYYKYTKKLLNTNKYLKNIILIKKILLIHLSIFGMNKKQMKQMERQMKKMGMKMEDLDGVREVIIRFDEKELIIDNPSVSLMNVMGQETYQIDGKAREVELELLIT